MIDTDVTRALAFIAVTCLLIVWAQTRAEKRRNERHARLETAAQNFADAISEFVEES